MLTSPRDTFRGQSRSPNIVPFHMLGIVFSCAIVTLSLRRAVFSDIRLQKCRDLEKRVRGPSRSLEMSPFDRAHMTSYWRSIVTMSLSRVVSEILKVVPFGRSYRFLLVFFSNFVPKMHRFWDIRLVIYSESLYITSRISHKRCILGQGHCQWPWNPG